MSTLEYGLNALHLASQQEGVTLRTLAYMQATQNMSPDEMRTLIVILTEGAMRGPDAARRMAGVWSA